MVQTLLSGVLSVSMVVSSGVFSISSEAFAQTARPRLRPASTGFEVAINPNGTVASARRVLVNGFAPTPATGNHVENLVSQAQAYLQQSQAGSNGLSKTDTSSRFKTGLAANPSDAAVSLVPVRAIGDELGTTVKFEQRYQGIKIIGQESAVHFNSRGVITGATERPFNASLNTNPTVTEAHLPRLVSSHFNAAVELDGSPALEIYKDHNQENHLVYKFNTRSGPQHSGRVVFLDAHSGAVLLEYKRAHHADGEGFTAQLGALAAAPNVSADAPVRRLPTPRALPAEVVQNLRTHGLRTVYSANTEEARRRVDESGMPTHINYSWYQKVLEDGRRSDQIDRSGLNAYRNAGLVYNYYRANFNRLSHDNRNSRINSIVHIGINMANAFWTDEFGGVMAYGDGDGQYFVDLSYGLDVAAHEMTHGVTANSANLVYAAEPGALNESFSDFFGKMVDYFPGNFDIGRYVMADSSGRRALRNMLRPEEFGQPNVNDSPRRIPTTGECTARNDHCGVHRNSGIPNRAAALIVEGIGKEKAERIYYRVLTTRLSSTSNFAEMKQETIRECEQQFGAGSRDCTTVTAAFATVKM